MWNAVGSAPFSLYWASMSLKTTSSQRWAIGAVALTVLIACSPRAPQEPTQPEPNAPTLSESARDNDSLTSSPLADPASQPGFAGVWAASEAACSDGAANRDTFRFEFGAADTIMQFRHNDLAPQRLVRCP